MPARSRGGIIAAMIPLVRNRSVFLLVSLVLIVGFSQVLTTSNIGRIIGNLLLCLAPITGVLALSDNRRHATVALALGIPAFVAVIHGTFFSDAPYTGIHVVVILLYYAFATVMILRLLFRLQRVTVETLSTAASAYLLIGVSFALAYAAVSAQNPDAFAIANETPNPGFEMYVYFSFVTLTTLGYGDISPVSNPARTLAMFEAVGGVLYLAMIISRLVALHQIQALQSDDR